MNINNNNKNTYSILIILKRIISHLEISRKKQVVFVLILTVLASLAESISIAMLIPFVSFFINPDLYLFNNFFKTIFEFLKINNNKDILATVSLFFALIVIISGYIKLKYIKISNELTENIESDFQIKMFKFLINQDFSYYSKHGSNKILSNIAQKSSAFSTAVFALANILNSIFIISAIIAILIFNETLYTLIIIISIGLFFIIVFKIKALAVFKKGEIVNSNQNLIIDIFENTVGYLPEIIIYNLKKFYSLILNKASQSVALVNAEIRTISMMPRIILEVFVIVFVIIFIYFSGFAERTTATNIPYLAILAFAAHKCLPLLNSIYNLSINLKGSTPTIVEFLDILEDEPNKNIDDGQYENFNFSKSILLKEVSYQYNKSLPKILNNINFEINMGDKIAIKGETGSGKSTLTNIISGLLEPTEGKILIDGLEITKKNIKGWQKNISIVPQIIFLNDATISENIAIAENLNEIDFDRVKQSAKLAHIDKFIESLPNKYEEEVGERGVRLSGGQRQRIGIARALYRNSNLIIMDEPTNSLDQNTENLVMETITKLKADITIVMVSHSNNTLKYFNKIIDLSNLK